MFREAPRHYDAVGEKAKLLFEKKMETFESRYGMHYGGKELARHFRDSREDYAYKTERLKDLTGFLERINEAAALEYLWAVGITQSIEALTSPEFMKFTFSLGSNALGYLNKIKLTENVRALTDSTVMSAGTKDFVKLLCESYEDYFWAIGKTGNVKALTDPGIMTNEIANFSRSLGKNAATYFEAIGKTGDIEALTSKNVIGFVGMAPGIAKEYLTAIVQTCEIGILTDSGIMEFALDIGKGAKYYLKALGQHEYIGVLTNERIMRFIKNLGQSAEYYLDVFESTGGAKALTDSRVTTAEVASTASMLGVNAWDYFRNIARGSEIAALTDKKTLEVISNLNSDANRQLFLGIVSNIDNDGIIQLTRLCERVNGSFFLREHPDHMKKLIEGSSDIRDLVKDRESLDAVMVYYLSGKKIQRPNKSNILIYSEITNDYLGREYGITKVLNMNQARMIFSLPLHMRGEIISVVNNSYEKDPKTYKINGGLAHVRYSRSERMHYIMDMLLGKAGSGTAAHAFIEELGEDKILSRALDEFNAGKWKDARTKLSNIMRDGGLEDAYGYMQKVFSKNSKIEELLNIIAEGKGKTGEKTLTSVISTNPLDFDSRMMKACIFLPYGVESGSAITYVKDKRTMFVRYGIDGGVIGVAVALRYNDVLLVNSVEGIAALRDREVFSSIFDDLVVRAKESGAERLLFLDNSSTRRTETAKEFIEFLSRKETLKYENRVDFPLRDFKGYTDISKENRFSAYIKDVWRAERNDDDGLGWVKNLLR